MSLSRAEQALAAEIDFEAEVFLVVKEEALDQPRRLQLLRYTDVDPATRQPLIEETVEGCFVELPRAQAADWVLRLRPRLAARGYMAFMLQPEFAVRLEASRQVERLQAITAPPTPRPRAVSWRNRAREVIAANINRFINVYKYGETVVGVIRCVDHYDILRILGTCSGYYSLSNAAVIAKLQTWEQCCTFEIIGAGGDHVHLALTTLPDDLQAFAAAILILA